MLNAIENVKVYQSKATAGQFVKKLQKAKPDAGYELVEVAGGFQILTAEQIAQITAPEGSTEVQGEQSGEQPAAKTETVQATDNAPKVFGTAPKGTLLVTIPNARLGKIDLQTPMFMGLQRWWKIEDYPGIRFDPATNVAYVPMTAKQIKSRKFMEPLLLADLPSAYHEPEEQGQADNEQQSDGQEETEVSSEVQQEVEQQIAAE